MIWWARCALLLGQGVVTRAWRLVRSHPLTDKARIQGALLEPEEIRDLLFLVDNITTWQALIERPPEAVAAQTGRIEGAERVARRRSVGAA